MKQYSLFTHTNIFLRPTYAEIDLDAFAYNFNLIKKLVPKNTDILPIIKADAYGHGMEVIAKKCQSLGASILGVATIEEGIFLRERGVKTPILILGSIYPFKNFSYVLRYRLTPIIASLYEVKEIASFLKNKKIPIHIKIDTGMGRIGISKKYAVETIKKIFSYPCFIPEGIFTHLASAYEDREFAKEQFKIFRELISELNKEKIFFRYYHIANSSAVFLYPQMCLNIVRPGIAIYGLYPFPKERMKKKLKPVLSLKTKVIYLKWIKKGTTISYQRTWKAKRISLIATLPIGYADGYNRLLSNLGQVLVRGRRAPIVGRVCMDMCMVDVTDIKEVKVGDDVVLIGRQGKDSITTEEIAQKINTINYEVTCGISRRVPRVYKEKKKRYF